ncbi:hypothetical protein [Actinokineospora enzanensis]|uniref:hypothetical protein n=1 Tax=Actinokineospora enzanensis TaxID=155975 RepID=UPI0003825BC8|nr:hypothetical protein [Actinokineospora enzanensis]
MSQVRAAFVAVAVLCVTALAGCAKPTAGTPVGVEITSTTRAAGGPEVAWMNRFCGFGKLLATAGDTAQPPGTSSDPAVLKRQFVEMTGRLGGVLDAALSDLRGLTPAPAPEVDPLIRELISSLTEARDAIGAAKSEVEAADPLTAEVFTSANNRLGTALPALERAGKLLKAADLPPSLSAAASSAPNCGSPTTPTTTS